MRKRDVLQRYLLIINKLKGLKTYVPSSEMTSHIQKELILRDLYCGVNLRTIQRDIKDIEELFGIEIRFERGKGYYIAEEYSTPYEQYENLLLNFDLLSAMDADSGMQKYILAEHHRPIDNLLLPELISAIRNLHPIEFNYTLIRYNDSIKHRTVLPHFLKESNQRWYLLAFENGILKTFSTDRISNLKVLSEETFKRDKSINIETLFKNCYGIWNQADIPTEDIELTFDEFDGKFLKSMPLHHSQKIICNTEDEFRITLHLRITNDFVMELLSRSRSLTVIYPKSLRKRVKTIYEEALKRNSQ